MEKPSKREMAVMRLLETAWVENGLQFFAETSMALLEETDVAAELVIKRGAPAIGYEVVALKKVGCTRTKL